MNIIISKVIRALVRTFKGRNLLWQILACVLTYIAVVSGLDWWWFVHFHTSVFQNWLFPAVILGGLVPIVLPITLFVVGKAEGRQRLVKNSYTLALAALLGWCLSAFYKIFTGRLQPPFRSQDLIDISHNFQFGILRHGVFWGWPSSHTTVAFSVAMAIVFLYPKNKFLKYLALLVALYIGIGVSTNIHWFSDFLAGAIMGSIIGKEVGKSFAN